MLAALPDTTGAGNTNNYTTLQEFTADYDKANGKIDLQASPTLSVFGRYGFRNLKTFDQPNIPLPSGGAGNGDIYARNRQAVLGTTWTPSGRSLFEVRFGYSWTQAGKNPPALGTDSALKQFGLPGLPDDPRIAGGLPTQSHHRLFRSRPAGDQSAVAVSDRLQPEGQLHLDDAAPTRFKTGYEFQWIDTEVQDVNPLYGRDTYNGSFTRPTASAAGEQSLQPRRLHARAARAVRAQQRAGRAPAPQHALRLPAGRLARRPAS